MQKCIKGVKNEDRQRQRESAGTRQRLQETTSYDEHYVPFLVFNGIDIVKEMLSGSGSEIRPIDIFMLVMAVISLVVLVINTVKWFEERKESESTESTEPK